MVNETNDGVRDDQGQDSAQVVAWLRMRGTSLHVCQLDNVMMMHGY